MQINTKADPPTIHMHTFPREHKNPKSPCLWEEWSGGAVEHTSCCLRAWPVEAEVDGINYGFFFQFSKLNRA